MAELRDCIDIPPEILCEIQDNSGNAIMKSLRHFVEEIFPDIDADVNVPEQQWIFGSQKWQY